MENNTQQFTKIENKSKKRLEIASLIDKIRFDYWKVLTAEEDFELYRLQEKLGWFGEDERKEF